MAKAKKTEAAAAEKVRGRALVDVPELGMKCGQFYTVNADQAVAMSGSGQFDSLAQEASPPAVNPENTQKAPAQE